jgi:hypothetical protein
MTKFERIAILIRSMLIQDRWIFGSSGHVTALRDQLIVASERRLQVSSALRVEMGGFRHDLSWDRSVLDESG